MNAVDALQRIRQGNIRFVSSVSGPEPVLVHDLPPDPSVSQKPFAVVLSCSDSRVPTELVLGQGFGDLFVVRVAGNFAAPPQVGSVEFAAERLGVRLVLVLGHTRCAAVTATIDELLAPEHRPSPELRTIIDRIRPAVEPMLSSEPRSDRDALVHEAIRANIRLAVEQLRHGSEVLLRLREEDGLAVVGAEYSVETRAVDILDLDESLA